MVDFVELSNKRINSVRTIEELLVEFVPQTFKRYFQNFLLKANQHFVEILTTTYNDNLSADRLGSTSCSLSDELVTASIEKKLHR